jgi:hypothetical protein
MDYGIRMSFRDRFCLNTVNASTGNDDMVDIEVISLNVMEYSRAANTQSLQKLTDGSFPSQSKP